MAWLTPEVLIEFFKMAGIALGLIGIFLRMSQLEKNTNSKMDQLLVEKGRASEALGNIKGRTQARAADAKILQKERDNVATESPKAITGELVGQIEEAGEKTKEITGEIKGEITHANESKTRQRKLASVIKKKTP